MPKENDAATESAPNKRRPLPILGVVAVLFGLYLVVSTIAGMFDNKTVLIDPSRQRMVAEIVDTDESRRQGLSGRTQLANEHVMLFVFDQPSREHCIWMKDMQFSLDIVWLDADKRVVYVKQNASPESYPETFCPPKEAKYVLEMAVGQADSRKFTDGATVKF